MTIAVPANPTQTLESLEDLSVVLQDATASLAKRFRALFALKSLQGGAEEGRSISAIAGAFSDPSALLKHELAYVLGQMRNPLALPFLKDVLSDKGQDAMVRHEAAEAIGGIGGSEEVRWASINFLSQFTKDTERVVRETALLAISTLKHDGDEDEKGEAAAAERIFGSVDPAPPAKKTYGTSELQERLLDQSLSLFERYRAMFALRNRGDTPSVLALARGFQDESALFRHEIAYVFGQMQHEASVPSLIEVLSNEKELPMVRHEAAEALGSIASPACFPVLEKYSKDEDRTVRDSCIIGLDMYEFESKGDFQYAL